MFFNASGLSTYHGICGDYFFLHLDGLLNSDNVLRATNEDEVGYFETRRRCTPDLWFKNFPQRNGAFDKQPSSEVGDGEDATSSQEEMREMEEDEEYEEEDGEEEEDESKLFISLNKY